MKVVTSNHAVQNVSFMASRRLQAELREINKNSSKEDAGIKLNPDDDSLMRWSAVIKGPADTPFHTATFHLKIVIPSNYPLYPPTFTFVTNIFHPNIHWRTGEICLDILKAEWSPIWGLNSTCLAILALLSHPEPDSPLNCDAGNLLRANDTRGYYSLARMYAIEHAGAQPYPTPTTVCTSLASISSTSSSSSSSPSSSSSSSSAADATQLVRAAASGGAIGARTPSMLTPASPAVSSST